LHSPSVDNKVVVVDARKNFEVVVTLEKHSSGVFSLAFSPDSLLLLSGHYDGTVVKYQVDNGFNAVQTEKSHTDTVWSLCFAPMARGMHPLPPTRPSKSVMLPL
jgi:WD40 repeat protein